MTTDKGQLTTLFEGVQKGAVDLKAFMLLMDSVMDKAYNAGFSMGYDEGYQVAKHEDSNY